MTKLVNRAKMTTATTGTGTITLGTAEAGYQSFADAGVVDADVVRYVIEDGTDWEIGTGTFGSAGGTLTRTVSESSNADAALNLTGSAVVFVSATAADIPPVLELYAESPSASPTLPTATGDHSIAIGNNVQATSGSVGIGNGARATANSSAAFGGLSPNASGVGSLALGYTPFAGSAFSTAIGFEARAVTGSGATALTNSRASGADSFAAAIANNSTSYGASGANSVAIGDRAKASGTQAISMGFTSQSTGIYSLAIGVAAMATASNALCIATFSSTASGTGSTVIGGENQLASNIHATVLGGEFNTASGPYSFSHGFRAVSREYGKEAHATGRFSSDGDAQAGTFVLRSDTTDATPEALTADNSTAGTTNQIILPNNSAYAFHGTIVARQQASQGTACAAWKIEGLIRREGSAATTVLVNSATTVLDNTPAWGMALSADTTNGGLKIEVTGAAATNIRWVATCHTSEVTF